MDTFIGEVHTEFKNNSYQFVQAFGITNEDLQALARTFAVTEKGKKRTKEKN